MQNKSAALRNLSRIVVGILAAAAIPSAPAGVPQGFTVQSLKMSDGSTRRYALFLPREYDARPDRKWPVILSLHGSGECGTDGVAQTTVGLGPYVGKNAAKFPCIVVMPQAHTLWFRGAEATAVSEILEHVVRAYRTDLDRVYLTGLSMGGIASWEIAAARPDIFAAVVPICGVGVPDFALNLRHVPIWAFHGAQDANVPVRGTRDIIEALRKLGAQPKYTEYPTEGHFIWDRVYATRELWTWLLKQRRPPPPREIEFKLPAQTGRAWWLTVQSEPRPAAPPVIRAEVREAGRIDIRSTGILAWVINSDGEPIKPGERIEVHWNGARVFAGVFSGRLSAGPGPAPATAPSPPERAPG